MQNLASATYCETRFVVDSARYNACLGLLNLNEDFDGVNGGNPFANLGLISEVTNDIADIYACATTEEQAYCVSKAKSYGIFTGVNGSKYNKCIADICAAKQPELTNLGLVSGAAGATIGAVTTVVEVSVDAAETVAGDIGDIYACATTEEQAYCVSKAKSYGVFTGVNGSKYNKCIADICAAKQPGLVTLLN